MLTPPVVSITWAVVGRVAGWEEVGSVVGCSSKRLACLRSAGHAKARSMCMYRAKQQI